MRESSISKLFLTFIFFVNLVLPIYGQGSILSDPIDTRPPGFTSVTSSTRPTNLWGTHKAPYPTNSFWTNLVLGDGTRRINIIPYQIQATTTGVLISMAKLTVSNRSILATFRQDISLQTVESSSARRIRSYDLLSVTVEWDGLQIPLVRGSAYITGIFENKRPLLRSVHAITSVNGGTERTIRGSRFEVTTNNNQRWIIYTSEQISLQWTNNQLQASAPFTGVLRVAFSSGAQMSTLLDRGRDTYPIGGEVSYTTPRANEALISFTWRAGSCSTDNMLMTALPHHVDSFVNANIAMKDAYENLRGPLSLVVGKEWVMKEALTTIQWNAPTPIPTEYERDIVAALEQDKNIRMSASDPYFFGKQVARNARLAVIADQLNRPDIASTVRTNVKSALNKWLRGENANSLQYDRTWGGICSKNGLANSGADFGNGIYNDHHFHYGYHIYAAAVIAKTDRQWLQEYSNLVNNLVRDYSNPSILDPFFPVTRNKDWFVGNSWASGLVVFGDSKNQESTSEAVNAYYAIYLWGLATGNNQLRDLGRVMLATEIRATVKYWQMTQSSSVYAPPFANNKVVGILWSTKVDYTTWFGSNVEFIHCIQMLPFTPASELHLPASWIREEYPILRTALSRTTPKLSEGWKGYVYMAHAIIDPKKAWDEVKTLTSYDGGNTKTNTLYWVATRPK